MLALCPEQKGSFFFFFFLVASPFFENVFHLREENFVSRGHGNSVAAQKAPSSQIVLRNTKVLDGDSHPFCPCLPHPLLKFVGGNLIIVPKVKLCNAKFPF